MDNWRANAACAAMPKELFFALGPIAPTVREACASCTVSNDCLEESLKNGVEEGIWAGKSKAERQRLLVA